jgi:cleavage stimulation factor subunit 2
MGYNEMDLPLPTPATYDMFRQEPPPQQPPPMAGRFARDPRNRDPRADRGMGAVLGRDVPSGPPPPLPPQLAAADPARRQLLMQVLQLPEDQIAALPADQRASILELKKQINAYPK